MTGMGKFAVSDYLGKNKLPLVTENCDSMNSEALTQTEKSGSSDPSAPSQFSLLTYTAHFIFL